MRTGVRLSRVGFGSSAAATEEHGRALARALEGGVTVVDTAMNYGGGESERLVGRVLRETGREPFLVTKLGYGRGSQHCLSPEFLQAELPRSLERLGRERVDACLLHNPEEILDRAVRHGQNDVEALRRLLRGALEAAFEVLEEQVRRGLLGAYGVSSNRLATSPLERGAVPLPLVMAAAGPNFRVLELPLNLFESQAALRPAVDGRTVLEEARRLDLVVLANRPLTGTHRGGPFRLKSVPPEAAPEDLEDLLLPLKALEREGRRAGGAAPRAHEALRRLSERLGNGWGADRHLERERTSAMKAVAELPEDWRARFAEALERAVGGLAAEARARSHGFARRVQARIDPLLPGALRREDLCRKALYVVASTPGVTTVLNGMRTPAYVEDALAVLRWEPLENPLEVYRALS